MNFTPRPIGTRLSFWITVWLVIVTATVDYAMPLGYGVWMFYLLAIAMGMRWAGERQIWGLTVLCMVLTAAGIYIPRHDQVSEVIFVRVVTTRFTGTGLMLLLTGLCVRQMRLLAAVWKALESEHEESGRIRNIIEGASIGILVVDESGVIQMHNEVLLKMFGYGEGELTGESVERLVPPAVRPGHAALRERYMRDAKPRRLCGGRELKAARKDGSEFFVDITVTPMDYKGRRVVIASINDLTEIKSHETLIARQNRRLRALREIDLAITGSLDLRLTSMTVLKALQTELEVDAAALLTYDRHDMTLNFLSGIGFKTEALQYTHLRLGEGYAGRVAETRKEVFIADLRQSSGSFLRSHHLVEEGFVSYMAVPLIAKGRVEGVLELFKRSVIDNSADWNGFLEALAGQTAIAIDNAEIYSDLEKANTGLRLSYDQTLEGWVHALDIRDNETEGHSIRVTELTMKLARMAGLPHEEMVHIRRGALLHDIGKLGIPDEVLLKPGKLTDEEWVTMKKHPVYAFEWLAPIDYLHPALDIPYCHHEKWDGTGYPRGLKGPVIPLAARLFAVVDVWDALRSDRPYRKAWSKEKVIEHIMGLAGTHFDPAAVEMFMKLKL